MSAGRVKPMKPTAADWKRVWAAIDARREELGWNLSQLYAATASDPTYRAMREDGKGVTRTNVKRRITDGLGWTPDSIDRLLDGKDPVPLDEDDDPQPPPPVDQATVDAIVEGATSLWEPALDTLQSMNERLARIEAWLGIPAPKPRAPRGSEEAGQTRQR